jgi:hypothetical protein
MRRTLFSTPPRQWRGDFIQVHDVSATFFKLQRYRLIVQVHTLSERLDSWSCAIACAGQLVLPRSGARSLHTTLTFSTSGTSKASITYTLRSCCAEMCVNEYHVKPCIRRYKATFFLLELFSDKVRSASPVASVFPSGDCNDSVGQRFMSSFLASLLCE